MAALRPGILHLGCGAFHRAHQAVFTQRAIEAKPAATPPAWGIVSASLQHSTMRDALQPQDGLYTVLERGPHGAGATVIGTLSDIAFAQDDPFALLARFTDPAIRLVTLTVTSSGYCLDSATERLAAHHPDIQRDLHASLPTSALGILVGGLARVHKAGRRPPVVMSCDNLPRNGRVLRQAAVDYAALFDDELAGWIASSVQFPCSMVDRITPATTEADMTDAAETLGVFDAAPVCTEPFRQWVIEDFAGPRPAWEVAGAEFVPDVTPWEASKLRLLNGTHMAIAYLGSLAGLQTVAEFLEDPVFAAYALRFMLTEQRPTLPPSRHDIDAYAHQLLQRWRNPDIAHQLSRVGRNGSEKLQPRLLASVQENLEAGRSAPCTLLAVAAWICCASERVGHGHAAETQDPLIERMHALGAAAGNDAERLTALALEMEDVFGCYLPRVEAFRTDLTQAVGNLQRKGPRAAIAALLADSNQDLR
ncbi:mannitol dehydrogenase family protein [Belnapia moabensis]|uniref:mannitol dehydrogenase family protein n=1 Tax=Belnapia moabensis TaxID=365533 RepID=UPI00146FF85F|nr:mannitol dehydrogenase family protein [Belnapia moabensis]